MMGATPPTKMSHRFLLRRGAADRETEDSQNSHSMGSKERFAKASQSVYIRRPLLFE